MCYKGSRDSTVFTIGWIYLIGNLVTLSSKPVLAQIHILHYNDEDCRFGKSIISRIYGFREKKPKNHYFYLSCYFNTKKLSITERERGMYPFLFIHSNRKSINLRIQ
ncbi:hypothetical protein ACJX0J_002581 (mitochondrion) [Zea mays]